MIAITTSSSTRVNADLRKDRFLRITVIGNLPSKETNKAFPDYSVGETVTEEKN
jgi:hypothetical protein